MKKLFSFLFVSISVTIFAQQRPKLIVGIVVDQMKTDYLYRFANDFSESGFKRLMKDGYTFYNMHYNYMPTFTAPGHASIYTGATPSVNGIVGNEWFSRSLGKEMYCVDDAAVKTLGNGEAKEGAMSPKNLQSTTITDELRLATNFKGKVIGISIKDRGAILPAGHFANWGFWFSKTGNFISSTFYGEKLPDWVNAFNSQKKYLNYINKGWNLLKPAEAYDESLSDNNPYEGVLYKSEKPVFPYDLKKMQEQNGVGIIKETPFGNDLIADFAKAAIENESLGKDDKTDFLTISFSSTDYIGHRFGPRSMEVQDTYLRLDLTIADFLNYLDKNVGKGNYLIFLTADHGGAENSKFLKDNKYAVNNFETKDVSDQLQQFSKETFGENLVLNYSNFNVFLNKELIQKKGLDLPKVKQSFKTFLLSQVSVKNAFTEEEILNNGGQDYYLNCVAKGYDVTQNGDLVILFKPGYMEHEETGTTHGTPYSYDTHVPLIFYGWNVKPGESHDKKIITQIAPTLTQKIKITFPSGSDGTVLTEILDK